MLITNKKLFYVNSRNRTEGTDSSFKYVFNLPTPYPYNRCVILQMQIPKSYYAIQSGTNTFTLKEGVTQHTITLTPGSYTRRSFQTSLQVALNAAGGWTYSIDYPKTTTVSDTGKFTYTVTGNSGQPQFIFGDNNIADSLGFARSSTNTFVSNSIISTQVISLQKEATLFLHSDICSNDSADNVLQEVFVAAGDAAFSNVLYTCINVEAYSKPLTSNSDNSYHFTLTDEDGFIIDLQGQNIVFTLMFFQYNNFFEMAKSMLKLNYLAQN